MPNEIDKPGAFTQRFGGIKRGEQAFFSFFIHTIATITLDSSVGCVLKGRKKAL